jgi:hypothetical protein
MELLYYRDMPCVQSLCFICQSEIQDGHHYSTNWNVTEINK